VQNAEKIDFPENYFDSVVSIETIGHLNNQEDFLSGIKKTLKKNGIFIISSPNSSVHKKIGGLSIS